MNFLNLINQRIHNDVFKSSYHQINLSKIRIKLSRRRLFCSRIVAKVKEEKLNIPFSKQIIDYKNDPNSRKAVSLILNCSIN